MSTILTKLVKALAEGKFGAGPAKAYWWLAGRKTYTGIALGAAYFVLHGGAAAGVCEPCGGYAHGLAVASITLVSVGLLDAAIREEPPVKPASVK